MRRRRCPGDLGAAVLLLAAFVAACGGRSAPPVPATPGRPALVAVPSPGLDTMAPEVRDQLAARRAAVDRLAAERTGDDARLASGYGDLGRLYHAYDLLDAAAACYENARRLAPKETRWAYYLGVVQARRGELEAAVASFEAALELAPDDPASLIRCARAQLARNRPDLAKPLLERAASHRETVLAAEEGLGQIDLAEGRFAEAARRFADVLAKEPTATRVHYRLGLAYRGMGDRARAAEELARRGDIEVAFADPRMEGLTELTEGAAAHLLRGGRAQVEGMGEVEIAEYRKAVAADPGDPAARRSLGAALARVGDLAGAVREYREAERLDPGSSEVEYNLGILAVRQGDRTEARARFEKAAAKNPDLLDAYRALAHLAEQTGDGAAAAEAYGRLLARAPDDVAARVGRAEARAQAGDTGRALADLDAVLASHPDSAAARVARGAVLVAAGRAEEGLAALRAVVATKGVPPEDAARAHLETAVALGDRGDTAGVRRELEAAVGLDPELLDAQFRLANALGAAGRYGEAVPHYRAVLAREPDNVPARLGEVTALALAARWGEARASLEEGLRAKPRDPSLEAALEQLRAAAPKEPDAGRPRP